MKRWKYMVVLVLSILLAVGLIRGIPILAAENTDMETIQVTGTYGQTEARQMLSLINEFRTSGEAWYWNESDTAKVSCGQLDALTYDYELERIAMQRAMEIAIYYSHTRPNGTDCFTLNTQGARAENIAAGYTTYEDVYIGWKEDNENHAGQGHRRNMLSEKYNVIGIGHVVYNGTHYWVQEFSSVVQDVVQKTANDSEQTVSIDILSSNITEKNIAVNSESCSVAFGKINNLPTVQGQIQTKEGWPENVFMPVDVTPEYSIENTYYASIINGSSVKGLNVGDTNITVSALGVNKIIPLTITPVSIQNAEITLKNNSYIYNGSMIQPAVQSVTVDETELGKNDYNVSYENNTNVGIGKGIVTGTGNYNGSVETSFTINPCNISTGILSEINNQTYTGEELKPSVILKVNNQSLSLDKDYTVSYENNINAGAATVTVVGKGNYTGTLTTEFQIVPRSISEGMVNQIGEQEYTGDAIVPGINLEVNHKTLTQGADYTIQYNNNTNCGNAEVAISGNGNYKGTLIATFKIVPRDISTCVINDIADQIYTGQSLFPLVNVSFNGVDLEQNIDYEIRYENNIEIGTAEVIITGKGNYTGETEKTFSIKKEEVIGPETGSDDDTSGSQSGISDQPSDDGQSGDPSSSEQSQPPANPDSFGNPSAPAVGETILSSDQTTSYKITGEDTVEYAKSASARKKAKVTIPSTVTYGGKTYQVTSVAAKAFKGSKKLKKATIPSTVTKIGKQAFASCKKLKTITIKTKKLTAKSVGKKAFKGINPKAVIKVPKKKLDAYRTILKARGVGGSVRIK